MTDFTQRKQFAEDFEAVRTLREKPLAGYVVGRALKRMRDSNSYREVYLTWSGLCEALSISTADSYRLIKDAEFVDSYVPSLELKDGELRYREGMEPKGDNPLERMSDDEKKIFFDLLEGRRSLRQISAHDSTNQPITIGDKVRFRGEFYTIKAFHPGEGIHGTCRIEFNEPQHTEEPADEVSVDFVAREV